MEDLRYDVAISFLSQDEPLAQSLYEELSKNLLVFVYSKKQEQLAGTDGLEAFRLAFRSQSRIVVVLYRNGWGQTPWTRVEEQAIKDRMLHDGWRFLLFVKIDPRSESPVWLPESEMWLDYTKFSNDLVGAIKIRALESGSQLKVETALDKAKRMNAITQAKSERDWKLRQDAGAAIPLEWAELRRLLDAKIAAIKPDFELQSETHEQYVVRTSLATLRLHPRLIPTASAQIFVETYMGRLLFREELRTQMYLPGDGPQRISTEAYFFDYNKAYDWCWREGKTEKLFTSDSLGELVLKLLLDAHGKIEAGKIVRRTNGGHSQATPWS